MRHPSQPEAFACGSIGFEDDPRESLMLEGLDNTKWLAMAARNSEAGGLCYWRVNLQEFGFANV